MLEDVRTEFRAALESSSMKKLTRAAGRSPKGVDFCDAGRMARRRSRGKAVAASCEGSLVRLNSSLSVLAGCSI